MAKFLKEQLLPNQNGFPVLPRPPSYNKVATDRPANRLRPSINQAVTHALQPCHIDLLVVDCEVGALVNGFCLLWYWLTAGPIQTKSVLTHQSLPGVGRGTLADAVWKSCGLWKPLCVDTHLTLCGHRLDSGQWTHCLAWLNSYCWHLCPASQQMLSCLHTAPSLLQLCTQKLYCKVYFQVQMFKSSFWNRSQLPAVSTCGLL